MRNSLNSANPTNSPDSINPRNSTDRMNSRNSIVVLITAGSEEEAHRIAGLLIDNKKAACVNIVPGVHSIFRWQG